MTFVRRDVAGVGSCRFYVYKRSVRRVRVKTPYWEEVFVHHRDYDWRSKDGKTCPDDALTCEIESLVAEDSR